MAAPHSLGDLLDRAGKVFSLAGKLGRAFYEEGQSRAIFFDPSIWERHAATFEEFCSAVLEVKEAMLNPPTGFELVAEQLLEAANTAKRMRDSLAKENGRDPASWKGAPMAAMFGVANPGPPRFTAYLDFYPELNTICQRGTEAIKQARIEGLGDPFDFVNQRASERIAKRPFTATAYPATPAGHVAFLEHVRDEVHNAAQAKRQQLERGYSNKTIENMVRGIRWAEANTSLVELTNLPETVRADVHNILHRELWAGTVEQIDALFQPAIAGIRDWFEQTRIATLTGKMVVVTTAGDLWKAYAEGKQPSFQTSGISITPGANTPTVTCTDSAAEAKRTALDRAQAVVTDEGGDKAVAMEKLIARVQLRTGLDKANVINMPLAEFVVAAMGSTVVNESQLRQRLAPRPDVLLITVNEQETRAILDEFKTATGAPPVTVPLDGRLYRNLGTLNGTTVFHALSEMGSSGVGAMQQTVDKAIRALDPAAVIAVGVAFGVNQDEQAIGDILLSKQLRPYDLQRMGSGIVLRGDKPHATPRLINHFEGFAQAAWEGATVRQGVLLTGEKLIDDIDYRNSLLAIEQEAVGGEMEGVGLYVACYEHKVDWIVIKAICDWADGKKGKNKKARQTKAAKNSAKFIVQALHYAPLKRHV